MFVPKNRLFLISLLVCEFRPRSQTWYQKFTRTYLPLDIIKIDILSDNEFVPHPILFQIVFVGVKGKGWAGDIAIDDIAMFKKWSCGVYPVAADPNPPSHRINSIPSSGEQPCYLKFVQIEVIIYY